MRLTPPKRIMSANRLITPQSPLVRIDTENQLPKQQSEMRPIKQILPSLSPIVACNLPPLGRAIKRPSNLARPQSSRITATSQNSENLTAFIQNVELLNRSVEVTKYGKSDLFCGETRYISMTPDLKHLMICDQAIRKLIPINQILQISLGRVTNNFKRFTSTLERNRKSCSFILRDKTLDIEFNNLSEMDNYLKALKSVLRVILGTKFIGIVMEQ